MSYAAPADLREIIRLRLNFVTYRRVESLKHWEEVSRGNRALRADGIYFHDVAGVPSILIAPTPVAPAGEPISLHFVYEPAALVNPTDEPEVPSTYHRSIVDYARAVAYGSQEDNADLDTYYRGQFSDAVGALRLLRQTGTVTPRDALTAEATS